MIPLGLLADPSTLDHAVLLRTDESLLVWDFVSF